MKNKLLLILSLTILWLEGCGQNVTQKNSSVNVQQINSSLSDWKTYTNKKYDFSFRYPRNWVENGSAAFVINLNGDTMSINIVLVDSKTKSIFSVEYFLAPRGAELYQYSLSDFKTSQGLFAKDSKQILIAGHDALLANLITTVDGKGQELSTQQRTIVAEFLDQKLTGEFKIQIRVPADNTSEIENFNSVLSTFEFANENKSTH